MTSEAVGSWRRDKITYPLVGTPRRDFRVRDGVTSHVPNVREYRLHHVSASGLAAVCIALRSSRHGEAVGLCSGCRRGSPWKKNYDSPLRNQFPKCSHHISCYFNLSQTLFSSLSG
jgi:hypothetical protein